MSAPAAVEALAHRHALATAPSAPTSDIAFINATVESVAVVVEYLTFEVDPGQRAAWMEIEERTWSRFLERQPGFVSKQLWVERGAEHLVHAVIVWADEGSWRSIPEAEIAAVDASMGSWYREASCRVFDVIRDR